MKNKYKILQYFNQSHLIKSVLIILFTAFFISAYITNTTGQSAGQSTSTINGNQNINNSNAQTPTNTPFAVATLVPTPPPTIESLAGDVNDLKQRMNETEQNVAQSANKVNQTNDNLAKMVADIEQIKSNTSNLTPQPTDKNNSNTKFEGQNEVKNKKSSALSNEHLLPPDVNETDQSIAVEDLAYKKRMSRKKRRIARDSYFSAYAPPPLPPGYGSYPPYGGMPYAPQYPSPNPMHPQQYYPSPYISSAQQYQQPYPNQTPYGYAGYPSIMIPNNTVSLPNTIQTLTVPTVSMLTPPASVIIQQTAPMPTTSQTPSTNIPEQATQIPADTVNAVIPQATISAAITPAILACGQGGSACEIGKTCFNQPTDAASPYTPCTDQNCAINLSKCLVPTEISCGNDAGNSQFGSACANNQICAINAQPCSIATQAVCNATAQCTPLNSLKCGISTPCSASQICAFNYLQCQDLPCMLNPFSFCVTPSMATCQVTGMCNYTTTHITSNIAKTPWYAGNGKTKDYDFANIAGLAVWGAQKMIFVSDTTSRSSDRTKSRQIKVLLSNGTFNSLPHLPGSNGQPMSNNQFFKLYVDKNFLYAYQDQKIHTYDLNIIPTAVLTATGEYPLTGWIKSKDTPSSNPYMPFAVKNDQIYYADSKNLITPHGTYQHNTLIRGLDVTSAGVVYFSDNWLGIFQYDSKTKNISVIKTQQGQAGYSGDCQNFKDMNQVFSNITDIKLSTDELNLFVMDAGNNAIRKIALDPSGKSQQVPTTLNRLSTIAGIPAGDSKCTLAPQRVLYPYISNSNSSLSIMSVLDEKTLIYTRQGLNQSDNQPTAMNMVISTVISQP